MYPWVGIEVLLEVSMHQHFTDTVMVRQFSTHVPQSQTDTLPDLVMCSIVEFNPRCDTKDHCNHKVCINSSNTDTSKHRDD